MPVDPVTRAHNRLFRYRIERDIYTLLNELEYGPVEARAATRKSLWTISPR